MERHFFERYTKDLSENVRYDYLLQSTKGRANEFVSNRRYYVDAMETLDREYGNKYVIMNLLLDDIKKLPT